MRDPQTLIKDAVGIFKTNPWHFVGIYLVAAIAMAVMSGGVIPLGSIFEWMGALRFDGLMSPLDLTEMQMRGIAIALAIFLIQSLMSVALIRAVADPVHMSVWDAYTQKPTQTLSYIVLAALMAVVLLVGFWLLIIPGVIAAVLFSVSYFVLVHEDKNGFDALKTSYRYVKAHWLDVFLRMLLPGVLIFLIHFLARGVVGAFSAGEVYGLVLIGVYTMFVPVTFAYMYLLYCDLRAATSTESTDAQKGAQTERLEVAGE